MNDCLVDTAVAIKWVVSESDSAHAFDFFNESQALGRDLLILDLGTIESSNAIWKRFHRKLLTRRETLLAYQDLMAMPLSIIEALPLGMRALEIACDYDIAVYDAHVVAAVEAMNCDGITADEPLVAKVGKDFPSIKLLKNWQPSP